MFRNFHNGSVLSYLLRLFPVTIFPVTIKIIMSHRYGVLGVIRHRKHECSKLWETNHITKDFVQSLPVYPHWTPQLGPFCEAEMQSVNILSKLGRKVILKEFDNI
ncbi:hypothetical protein K435DRAFT_338422 [Dendrothele bispora CBS 962.96]|uniref:Uncharacterized protein n=1 Tax=Dendrothele bispora (strain CBS 962.96) TaxID=1314807 RepID=A0A4S8MIP4_DENBC|nr:hypothetical protein K435DRAFT_338422 [Dendrothele bispora CBS 962.96]